MDNDKGDDYYYQFDKLPKAIAMAGIHSTDKMIKREKASPQGMPIIAYKDKEYPIKAFMKAHPKKFKELF